MSHKGIRSLIEDVALSLGDDIQFTYARTSDFNLLRDKRYPFVSLDLLVSSASFAVNNVTNYSQVWRVQMAFYELDHEGSDEKEYAVLLDQMDVLVDNFIQKLNNYAYGQVSSNEIIITGMNKTPFIKTTSDILTGWLLNFQLQAQDHFNYCGLDC